MFRSAVIALTALICATPALAADANADANAGRNTFQQQCALCHSAQPNDNGGGQGPNLDGLFGRHAAADPSFGYTRALRESHLTWDAATLDRFLRSPATVVPGTAMVISVPQDQQRHELIAYFQALKDGTFKLAPRAAFGPPPGFRPPASGPVPENEYGWKNDAPGRAHRVDLAHLPAPLATPAAVNFPRVVPRPADAQLSLPPGFKVAVFARDVQGPRELRIAPNGDIFVSETQSGRVVVLRPSADGATAEGAHVFAQGLTLPSGMAFYPGGSHPHWLYVAENNRVVRYPYRVGDRKAGGLPQIVVPQLSPVGGGGHFTRDVVFSKDGKRMFVSVGSQSNIAEDMPKKTPEQIRAWEAQHGLGAAWGSNANRADVLVFDVGAGALGTGSGASESGSSTSDKLYASGKVYASGIRNCAGLTLQPQTGALWCTVNERDLLGDDLVPDYSTRVREGGFYGWPWYYMGDHEDPRHAAERPDLRGKILLPDVPYQAHAAALSLVFYTATSGSSAFPRQYLGDGFAVMHGSWNRAVRTGGKVVRVRMRNGIPTGEYDDFMVGFVVDDGHVWGRPVAAAVARDGSLLLTDDGADLIYRISYAR
ncbi:MAG TPA: PQQ-dependent sugar dehydrogenase [Steroidobacteraceae bacterium]|nr:PQQ-dependent sugar dehydrogenase [Steroidobacteraceae bacterium]